MMFRDSQISSHSRGFIATAFTLLLLSLSAFAEDFTPPRELLRGPTTFAPKPNLAVSDGAVYIAWRENNRRVMLIASTDSGESFSPSRVIIPDMEMFSGPVIGDDGAAYMGFSRSIDDRHYQVFLAKSTDRGQTFTSQMVFDYRRLSTMVAGPGLVYMLLLDNNPNAGGLFVSTTRNGGTTWSAPQPLQFPRSPCVPSPPGAIPYYLMDFFVSPELPKTHALWAGPPLSDSVRCDDRRLFYASPLGLIQLPAFAPVAAPSSARIVASPSAIHVLFTETYSGCSLRYAVSLDEGMTFSSALFHSDCITNPYLATDNNGRIAVIWLARDIFLRWSEDEGQTFSTAHNFSNSGRVHAVNISADLPQAMFHLVWSEETTRAGEYRLMYTKTVNPERASNKKFEK